MKKLSFSEQTKNNDFDYCGFYRVTKSKSKNNIPFWRYNLVNKISQQEQEKYLKMYNNITFSTCTYRYAPEIREVVLNVFDKKII